MRGSAITFVIISAALVFGCAEQPAPAKTQTALQRSRVAASVPTVSASGTASPSVSSDANSDLVTVVREAYGMAEAPGVPTWSSDSATRVKARLPYYSRRFGDSLARVFAEYDGPERIMFPPDSVVVLHIVGDEAEVAYPTPIMLKEIWGRPDYTIDRLRRESGRWRIVESRGSAEKPAGVTAPPT